ncbi:lipopolysaccharide biosynthesis protein [Bradyrhizobium sp. WSM471]|uniref:lipopolysaccharide biosynthesis protein n=1 Tax=Bradyrhizobium sp. WSM471 TaxID=319017 RepID=UPI00024D2C23|nr:MULTISPECIES: oligosaccharide flippase family protein [Bradyrhizobium]EHR04622.1 membrane protein involved in the export of O-antigen and teichoic acid [Bradyrhizobium sp. WSM471]UFW39771.1 oligosaccharide flippase family protein [Bradyrhizobium canariense]
MQNRLPSLRRDTLIYGVAVVVDRLVGVALLPILTANMDRWAFGAWTQVLTTFALMSNILSFGFFHSLSQYVPGSKRGDIRRILNGVLLIVISNGIICVALALTFPNQLGDLIFGDRSAAHAIIAASVFMVTESLFEILVIGFLRADSRLTLCSLYYSAKSAVRLLLMWGGLLAGFDLAGLLWLLSVSNLLVVAAVYFVHVLPTLRAATVSTLNGFWTKAFLHSGGIVLSSNLAWANASLGRFAIVHILGLSSLGLYSANYSLASIVSLSALVINFTAIPHMNAAWNAGSANRAVSILTATIEHYLFLTIPVAVALGLFYDLAASLLIHGDFNPEPTLMWALIVTILLMGLEQLLSFATFMVSSRFSVVVRLAGLLLNLVIVYFCILPIGLIAVAIAMSASSLVVISASAAYLSRLGGFVFPWRSSAWLCAAGLSMIGAAVATKLWLDWASLFGAGLVGLIGLLSFLLVESLRDQSICRNSLQRPISAWLDRLMH